VVTVWGEFGECGVEEEADAVSEEFMVLVMIYCRQSWGDVASATLSRLDGCNMDFGR
jgi:hypothetical protein